MLVTTTNKVYRLADRVACERSAAKAPSGHRAGEAWAKLTRCAACVSSAKQLVRAPRQANDARVGGWLHWPDRILVA